ncbi:MAG: hypothetical protein E7417_00860 [Ruminococcaceae bacterium]|nr:hypothetical protein [Oscillospiraceae bacterium]
MDENKNYNELEETQDVLPEENNLPQDEEIVEEAAVDAVEETEDAVEETVEDAEPTEEAAAEDVQDSQYEAPAYEEVAEVKKSKTGLIVTIIILVVALIAGGAYAAWKILWSNPYNRMGYVDISGKTVQDLADQMGVDVPTFLAQYELPEDMPANTTESAAYYNIPVKVMAQMFGMDYATMKETLKFPETVTEDTPWGEAEGEVTIQYYVGEENLATFKEQYGLGDDITLETKWKEVRNIVDQAQKDARIEQEKAMEEAAKNAEQAPSEDAPVDAPAEGEDAPADAPVEDAPVADPPAEETPAETPAE